MITSDDLMIFVNMLCHAMCIEEETSVEKGIKLPHPVCPKLPHRTEVLGRYDGS